MHPHLSKAPISEAVIAFTCTPSVEVSLQMLKEACSSVSVDYEHLDDLSQYQGLIEQNPGEQPLVTSQDLGWIATRFKSNDGRRVVRFGKDIFTFSHLRPYSDWEKFQSEAFDYWAAYVDIAKPEEVSRIGLRYINQCELPNGRVELDEYLVNAPKAPHGLENTDHLGFLHQDRLDFSAYYANWIRTIIPTKAGKSLVVDIDVVKKDATPISADSLLEHLLTMRRIKNDIFFGTLTSEYLGTLR